MFNIWWGILFVIVNYGLFTLCYRLFGIKGMYAWIGVATVLANVQVIKTIELFGVVTTLGNTMYVSMYLASDLLNEKFGPKVARKAIWFGFFTLIMTTIIMQMVLEFDAYGVDGMSEAQSALITIFGQLPRLMVASLSAYLISQFLDVRLYTWLRQLFPAPHQLWIRNNGSTMISSFVDTLVFCSIAFLGVYEWQVWIEIFLTTYILKFVLTAAGTPFLYIARGMKVAEEDKPLMISYQIAKEKEAETQEIAKP
ncbi:queuosine precursor transporter [Paenibacillus sp. PsM32]|uniref:queuosine precursor transporter n=1 Tax=Paenibacillus sp. PsM32 TaxID=3030536 RepID=UPI00263AE517|nr:queuosine precursor transporter [Paenibacillus sp. PsM32]MDN4617071.1 queuosine precursor transporter [Paenibacillus sp. PsM32]